MDCRLNPDEWADPWWRLCNLYRAISDDGKEFKFYPNDNQERLYRNLWFLNLILKARQQGFCVEPSTLVLTADLRWVRADSLTAGDELVGVDEHPPGGRGKARRMRAAIVQGVATVRRQAFTIRFDDGRSVVCTDRHPWLSRKAATDAKWRSLSGKGNAVTGRLKIGTEVRWICKPWDAGGFEDGWMGGMLDGEGSIAKTNASAGVGISQVDGPVWRRMVQYAEARGYHACTEADDGERKTKFGGRPVYCLNFGRLDEMLRLIGQTRPTRFLQNRFWENRELPGKKSGVGWSRIVAIEDAGERELVDLQTSTGTYIAEGFVSHNTTFIDLILLDQALFNANKTCGIIADTRENAGKIFRNKVRFPYDKLPLGLRIARETVSETSTELVFDNGSNLSVGTSMRGGTLQYLHISEYGKISAKFPDKAKEIKTGAFNAVAPGQFIFIESTAEGKGGEFYEQTKAARAADAQVRAGTAKLTPLDFRFHFFAWWEKPANTLDPTDVRIGQAYLDYFEKLDKEHGIKLTAGQKAWYVKKHAVMGDDMKKEHPSTPDEAFEVAIDGAYYAAEMLAMRKEGRICKVPWVPNIPVNTFWDIGSNDVTFVWFHQRVGLWDRYIRTHSKAHTGFAYWAKYLQDTQYVFGTHYLPHDAEQHRQTTEEFAETSEEMLNKLGVRPTVIVPRVLDIVDGIRLTRPTFATAMMDETGCEEGIAALDNYQHEWDEKLGDWKSKPLHNWASNGADAYRQRAQGYIESTLRRSTRGARKTSWRTA